MPDLKCIYIKECFPDDVYSRTLVLGHEDGSTEELTFEQDQKFVIYNGQLLDWWGRPVTLGDGMTSIVGCLDRARYVTQQIYIAKKSNGKLVLAVCDKIMPSHDLILPTVPELPSTGTSILSSYSADFENIKDEIAKTPIGQLLAERANKHMTGAGWGEGYAYIFEGYDYSPTTDIVRFCSGGTFREHARCFILPRETILNATQDEFASCDGLKGREEFFPKTIDVSEDGLSLIATYADENGKQQLAYIDTEVVAHMIFSPSDFEIYWCRKD